MQTHQLQAREESGPPGPLAAPSQSSAGPSVSQKPVQTAAHTPESKQRVSANQSPHRPSTECVWNPHGASEISCCD